MAMWKKRILRPYLSERHLGVDEAPNFDKATAQLFFIQVLWTNCNLGGHDEISLF